MEYLCQWPRLTCSGTRTLPGPGAGRAAPRGVAGICQRDGEVAAVPLVPGTAGGMHDPGGQPGLLPIRITHAPGEMSPCHETGPRTPAPPAPRQQAGKALPRPLFVCHPHRAKRRGEARCPRPRCRRRSAAISPLPAAPGSADRRCRRLFRPFPHRSAGPATVTRPPGRTEAREAKGRRGTIATRSRRPRGRIAGAARP